jgi:23S rRNA (guanosine2251-2'-O)-methyltransferase
MERRLMLVIHDVRSIFNVASLFRTADAAGVEKIILTGYSPGPLDRFERPQKNFLKVSLGAEQSVPWERASDVSVALETLKKDGFTVAALEQDQRSIDYRLFQAPHKVALIVGNETGGIPPDVLSLADVILEIPMQGKKESLNVEVAGGIALFSLRGSQ